MGSIVYTVLELSILGTLLTLILLMLKPIMRNVVSRGFQYYIWLVVLIRFILPFGYMPQWAERPIEEIGEYKQVNSGYNSIQDGEQEVEKTDNIKYPNQDPEMENSLIVNNVFGRVSGEKGALLGFGESAAVIWIVGTFFSAGWYIVSYMVFTKKLRKSLRAPHPKDMSVFIEISNGKNVEFACSDYIRTPMLFGVFKPVIVIPEYGYCAKGKEKKLRNILLHEVTHYKRADLIYKWFVIAVKSVHWFNPTVYFISREIDQSCELSCDERVICNMSKFDRRDYGNTLLELAATTANNREASKSMVTTFCDKKEALRLRLMNIKNYKRKSVVAVMSMILFGTLLTGCAAVYPFATIDVQPKLNENAFDAANVGAVEMSGMFHESFLGLANGKIQNDWEIVKQLFKDHNYHYYDGEGTFFADDPGKTGCYLSGTLIENNKIIKIDRIVYHYAEDNGERTVMAKLGNGLPCYYVAVNDFEGTPVHDEDEMLNYMYNSKPDEPESEEKFLNEVINSSLLADCKIAQLKDYYDVPLANVEYLPEGFKACRNLFVKEDQGTGDNILLRVWYNYATKDVLLVSQFESYVENDSEYEFTFSSDNMAGSPIKASYYWASYFASYGRVSNGKFIYSYMLVTDETEEELCREILQSVTVSRD